MIALIKKNQQIFQKALILSSIITLLLSFILSYYIKFQSGLLEYTVSLPLKNYFNGLLLFIPFYIIIASVAGIYDNQEKKDVATTFIDIAKLNVILFFIILSILFIFRIIDFSREFLFIFFAINTLMQLFAHYFIKRMFIVKINEIKVLLVKSSKLGKQYINEVKNNPFYGIKIEKIINYSKTNTFKDMEKVLSNNSIDEVVFDLPLEEYNNIQKLLNLCELYGVKSLIIPAYTQFISANPHIDKVGELPLIDTRYIPLDNLFHAFCKRVFDIVFSLFAIIVTSPIMLTVLILIGKKPIYKQIRVGKNKKNFTMYKFRSMKIEYGNDNGWSTKEDDRRTKIGSIIRKLSIDELPQFFNVLKGDMSIVGPRPERPFYVEKFKDEIPKYMIKHLVRPGITGQAQIKGLRGDTSIIRRIEEDINYIENWSFALDIKIIFNTLKNGIYNKNAY